MKTREEVEELKRQWAADGGWDIEETEGFEDYKDELLAFARAHEEQAERKWQAEVNARGVALACSPQLAEYIIRLEQRLDALTEGFEREIQATRPGSRGHWRIFRVALAAPSEGEIDDAIAKARAGGRR